jgi:hypothetical protein
MTLLAAIATFGALASSAAPAQAHLVRPVSSFTPTGTIEPVGVAVDQETGDLYVAGLGSGNVERFSGSGTPEPFFVSPILSEPWGVAVDQSTGDVYVAELGAAAVDKLEPSAKPVAGFTRITEASIPAGDPGSEGFKPHGVAVDPANGDVAVEDEAHGEVDIFSSSGAFISQFAGGTYGVAVGSGSDIYTSGGEGVQEFSPTDGYSTPTTIDPNGALAVGVDLLTGDVLSDDTSHIAEYEASGAPLVQFGSGVLSFSAGVAVYEATDTVYATDISNGNVYVFRAPVRLPDVTTGTPPTNVTSTTATLSGAVNPDTTSVTGCRFEYGTSTSYGASVACTQALPLTGTSALPVSVSLGALQPNATYHYRLAGANSNGTSFGEDQTFTTSPAPPTLDDQSVSGLTQTSAILNASIDPNNEATTYHFEYGPTAAYGTSVPVPEAEVGSEWGDVVVGQQLSGLEPGTTYHFRVVATNATGPSTGVDQTFTTASPLPPILSTGLPSAVSQNEATLSGTIDAQGVQTSYEFDIGADTSYGTRIFGDAGTSEGPQTFTLTLQDLAAGVTYHYRLVARNTYATTYGADQTFTTPAFPSLTLTAPVAAPLVPTPLIGPAATAPTAVKVVVRKAQPKRKAKRIVKKARRAASSRKRRS